jgi:TetR/AcrR family transcriptional regulator, transcriptional repressor of bet genes
MPKIVDHAKRREEIAHVACEVVARYGFEQATMVRIARSAGYTSGMVAHYFGSKQEIILAALRLILQRIEHRLTQTTRGGNNLLAVLSESLAIDSERFIECAFWITFWGQVSADRQLKRINAWVHREYWRLFERCFAEHWQEWSRWPARVRRQVLRSAVTFINGLTASAVTSPADWPAATQIEQLRVQLELLRSFGARAAKQQLPRT